MTPAPIKQLISNQMSSASRKRTATSRKRGGAKAWQTRLANLSAKLAEQQTISPASGQ
jgi:hypothetical protein